MRRSVCVCVHAHVGVGKRCVCLHGNSNFQLEFQFPPSFWSSVRHVSCLIWMSKTQPSSDQGSCTLSLTCSYGIEYLLTNKRIPGTHIRELSYDLVGRVVTVFTFFMYKQALPLVLAITQAPKIAHSWEAASCCSESIPYSQTMWLLSCSGQAPGYFLLWDLLLMT